MKDRRCMVVLKVMVSGEVARALRSVDPVDRAASLARFLSAQETGDLRDSVQALRVVPWSDPVEARAHISRSSRF